MTSFSEYVATHKHYVCIYSNRQNALFRIGKVRYILFLKNLLQQNTGCRGGSRTAATSKMELFVIIVNGFKPLTIITKSSILDVAAVLDPPLG